MSQPFSSIKLLSLLALSSSLLALSGCSPKVKIALWAKKHQEAALALEGWAASNPTEAATLLELDCIDRYQFRKRITNALDSIPREKSTEQSNNPNNYLNYLTAISHHSQDGFADWCRKYPKAAKKLRSHAKALCKTGLGILNGTYKIN